MKGWSFIFNLRRALPVFVILFSALPALAGLNGQLKLNYRNKPAGQNLLATAAYDGLLWGTPDTEMPLYGFYRAGLVAGGTPTAAAFVEVAPVAPLVFRLQKGSTYRYLESSVFECAREYCFGVADRTDLSVTAVGAYGRVLGLVSYLWRDLRLPESSNPVVAEQEYFTARAGRHNYGEWTVALGYKLVDNGRGAEIADRLGLQYTAGEISEGHRRMNSVYAVYQWSWQGLNLTAGAGHFDTDQPGVSGEGLILAIGKNFGESLSLF